MRALLREVEAIRDACGPEATRLKLESLRRLDRARLKTASEVLRLHELLCYLRAYPEGPELLAQVEGMLRRFSRRSDLGRHRLVLADSGIAGTPIRYRFFWETARWLARCWPSRLEVDWDGPVDEGRLAEALPLLAGPTEAVWLRTTSLTVQERLHRLSGPRAGDGAYLVRRIESMPGDTFTREALHDGLDTPYVLRPGPEGPSRTGAHFAGAPLVFRKTEPPRGRPDLVAELRRPPKAVSSVSPAVGRRLIDLARESMVTRCRDLDAFAFGEPSDVRLVDDGEGLVFVAIGMRPERRLLLPAAYGHLTLRNGVPIGYVQTDALYRSAAVSFNTFETFRGGEAAHVFGRMLAMTRHLFGAKSFSIEPYQLGLGNEEGLASGAWWFYYKLGFRPKDLAVQRTVRAELGRMREDPRHRSSRDVLVELSRVHLYFEPDQRRRAVLPPAEALSRRVTDALVSRAGADRERAYAAASEEAARLLGVRSLAGWSAGERFAWKRWSPLVLLLPRVHLWSAEDRRALARVVRAKGGRRESGFVRRFDAHPKLGSALLALDA